MSKIPKRIGIFVNEAWNIYNFRMNLLSAISKNGYEVIVFAPHDKYVERIPYPVVHIEMRARNASPLRDLLLLIDIIKAYSRHKPSLLLHFTAKPNIYGTLAARVCRIPVINNIAGLGSSFSTRSFLKPLMICLYRASQGYAETIFFQNEEDESEFIHRNIVDSAKTKVLPGSGIDVNQIRPSPRVKLNAETRFLLVSRLLHEKGIREYIEAATILKKRYGAFLKFELVGKFASSASGAITLDDLETWNSDNAVIFSGPSDNVIEVMRHADCVVLPSYYREGVPRVLLEAASLGKPLITTDNIGCRVAVHESENGFLCKPRDSDSLMRTMEKFIKLNVNEKLKMGVASRKLAIEKFDEKFVIHSYLEAIGKLFSKA